LGTNVSLQGPYGTSFGLTKEESGVFVIVAGGTGLFPFLDLLDFLLRKTIYDRLLE
jgi:NAD(P)H-flavin reductase